MTDRRTIPQPQDLTLVAAAQRARALAARQVLHALALPAVAAQHARKIAAQQVLHACALTMRALAAPREFSPRISSGRARTA